MADAEVRRRVSQALREMNHRPAFQGGKGRGLTAPQKRLLDLLGTEWTSEFVIRTGLPKGNGNATWYAADLAHEELMVCVEIDGGSHCSRKVQERDACRDEILSQLGWLTLRYSNAAVLTDAQRVSQEIMSTISRLRGTPTTSPTTSSSTTAT